LRWDLGGLERRLRGEYHGRDLAQTAEIQQR
jgi:hypothetical protein